MIILTNATMWLDTPTDKGRAIRASIATNDINSAFNCVVHKRLVRMFKHCRFLETFVQLMCNFNFNRSVDMVFNGMEEPHFPCLTVTGCSDEVLHGRKNK